MRGEISRQWGKLPILLKEMAVKLNLFCIILIYKYTSNGSCTLCRKEIENNFTSLLPDFLFQLFFKNQ